MGNLKEQYSRVSLVVRLWGEKWNAVGTVVKTLESKVWTALDLGLKANHSIECLMWAVFCV